MAGLTGKTLAATYQGLLKLSTADNQNFDGSLRNIVDGEDTASNISLTDPTTGESIVKISGAHADGTRLQINTTNSDGDTSIGFAYNGTDQWIMGRDDSDGARFKIHYGSAFGTGVADTNVLTLEHTGNVGIGLCDAGARLHVRNDGGDAVAWFESADNDSAIYIIAGTAGHNSLLYFDVDDTDPSGGVIRYDHHATQASQKMEFITGDFTKNAMRITGDGNVHIGTDNGTSNRASLTVDVGHATLPAYYIGEDTYGFTTTSGETGGGWARGLNACKRSDEANLGRFGFYGGDNSLTYQFIGTAWDSPTITIFPTTYKVGIGDDMDAPLTTLHVHKDVGSDSAYGMFMLEDTGASTHHQSSISNSRQGWTTFCTRRTASYSAGGHAKFYCSNGWNELWVATTSDVLWCQFYINSSGEYSRGHVINRKEGDTSYVTGATLRSFDEYIELTHDASATNRATMKLTNRSGSIHYMWGYLRSYTGRMQIISGTYDE